MSVVYRAHDQLRDRAVALKILRAVDEEPRNILFLQQEFRAMARLRHPRLVQVFDYGVLDNGTSYFTMELLGGADLSKFRDLPLQSIFQILLSIADVLGFMHVRGYAHRDIKPSNVRILRADLDQAVDLKLMDCGLTERLGRECTSVAGTLSYLAPEAWLGSRPDARGDLYALGVLAYEITAGHLPFDTSTGVRLLKAKTERPKDLREVRPDVPAEYARLVRDLLMPEPASRPASAMEVIARLAEFADLDFQLDPAIYLRTPALVGRSRELGELRSAVDEACTGKPTPTIIIGPAGAGKTRLFEELLLELGLHGAFVARATGRGFSGGPFEVLQELILPLLHLPSADAVLSRIGGRKALLPAGRPSDHDAPVDPMTARQSMFQAFATFLDGVSKHRRVILAIDDIHLADAASIDALAGLGGAGIYGNIAIVATERANEPVSPSLSRLMAGSRLLQLERMAQTQIGELIAAARGPVSPSLGLVRDLERASDGNVHFALEILRSLAAAGLIERKRTRVTLPDSLDGVTLPATLSDAIERRLAALSKGALALARAAAVVGRTIELIVARALVDASDDEFLDAVDELRREELVQLQDRRLSLHHRQLKEVLYLGLSAETRQQLHHRVAVQLLARSGGPHRIDAAELGQHFAEAGLEAQALEYLIRAGDARYDGFAYYDAREAYQRAFKLLPLAPVKDRRELERKLNDRLGRICFYHDHENGPEYLDRARHFHLRHGFLWAIVPLSRLLGATLAVFFAVAMTVLLDLLRLRRRPLEVAMARLTDSFATTTYLSNCYNYSGHSQLAIDAAEQLLPFVYSRGRIPRVGYLMARAYPLFLMNRLDESAQASHEALQVLRQDLTTRISEHDRVHATGGALITRLWIDLVRGYTQRSPWWQPFEQYVQDHPTALLESWLMEARVFAAYRRGKLAKTEAAWKQFAEKASQAEVMFVQSKSKVWVGMAYLDAGRTSEALDMADEVIRAAQTPENPLVLALGLQLRGMALHAWEQLDDAQLCLEQAADLTRRSDVHSWEAHHGILISLALLLRDRNELPRARELAAQVEARSAQLTLSHDFHRCRSNRILGRIALAEGDTASACEYLEKALTLAAAMDDPLERARSCHFYAEALLARGDDAEARLCREECQQLLLELGNDYQLRRLGYIADEKVESSRKAALVSRRATAEAQDATLADSHAQHSSSPSEGKARESLLNVPERELRETTLVAAVQGDASSSERR